MSPPSETASRVLGLDMPIPNQPLSSNPIEELWPANGAVERIEMEGAVAASDGNAIVVALEGTPTADAGLEAVARESYRRLLRGVARFGYPNVVRIWNYVPRIHEKTSGIDRYMCFCKGRSEAFAAHYGDAFASRLPAASAVGCPGDALVVHALATRDPVRYVENPRQVSAYRYPERYGPKSPSFARGTVTQGRMGGAVFVSGTASIVGHESVFPGDPLRQTAESMRNIETVLNEASVPGPGGPLGSRLRSLRVYVRFPEQLPEIRRALGERTGPDVPTSWFQAEICREELLVEIEATARTAQQGGEGDPDLRSTGLARKD